MNLLPNNKTVSFPLHGVALQHSHKKNEGSSKKKHSLKIFMDFTDFIFPSFPHDTPFFVAVLYGPLRDSTTTPLPPNPRLVQSPQWRVPVESPAAPTKCRLTRPPATPPGCRQVDLINPRFHSRTPQKKTPRNLGFKVPLVGSRKVPLNLLMDLKFKLSVFWGLKNSVVINSLYF